MLRIICVLSALLSLSQTVWADEPPVQADARQDCINHWVQKNTDVNKAQEYQNFASVFCTCFATRPFADKNGKVSAWQFCLSQNLLSSTMVHLNYNIGFTNTTPGDVREFCQDYIDFLYPDNKTIASKVKNNFCPCIKTRLFELALKAENMPDQAVKEGVDKIADLCRSGMAAI